VGAGGEHDAVLLFPRLRPILSSRTVRDHLTRSATGGLARIAPPASPHTRTKAPCIACSARHPRGRSGDKLLELRQRQQAGRRRQPLGFVLGEPLRELFPEAVRRAVDGEEIILGSRFVLVPRPDVARDELEAAARVLGRFAMDAGRVGERTELFDAARFLDERHNPIQPGKARNGFYTEVINLSV